MSSPSPKSAHSSPSPKPSPSTKKNPILEGVFAINKPASISSAQVIRNLQERFNPSTLFAPWIANERAHRNSESHFQRKRRRDKRIQVKIGHGGTLDPMATGVLILGVGSGTKELSKFLDCTKSYEATIVFGTATDSYDALGKILKTRAPVKHLNRDTVERALRDHFTGKIMQRPPLFSALSMQGKRLYEYAREGKELPREIEKRPVEVQEIEVVEWLEGGQHDEPVPKEEAAVEDRDVAEKVLHLDDVVEDVDKGEDKNGREEESVGDAEAANVVKRKRSADEAGEDNDDGDALVVKKNPKLTNDPSEEDSSALMSGALQDPSEQPTAPEADPSHNGSSSSAELPPAVRIRMTVTSGFYVRSLTHDLGEAVGSLGYMSRLVRTRQGDFELGKNVLDYDIIDQGEEVWGPKVQARLDEWQDRESESR